MCIDQHLYRTTITHVDKELKMGPDLLSLNIKELDEIDTCLWVQSWPLSQLTGIEKQDHYNKI